MRRGSSSSSSGSRGVGGEASRYGPGARGGPGAGGGGAAREPGPRRRLRPRRATRRRRRRPLLIPRRPHPPARRRLVVRPAVGVSRGGVGSGPTTRRRRRRGRRERGRTVVVSAGVGPRPVTYYVPPRAGRPLPRSRPGHRGVGRGWSGGGERGPARAPVSLFNPLEPPPRFGPPLGAAPD